MSRYDLRGKVVLITGARGGIGGNRKEAARDGLLMAGTTRSRLRRKPPHRLPDGLHELLDCLCSLGWRRLKKAMWARDLHHPHRRLNGTNDVPR